MSRPPQAHAKPKVVGPAERDDQALRLPTLAEARKALEDHLATFPGTHEECYGHPEKERARQFWLERKELLKTALEVAQRTDAGRWRSVPVPTHAPVPHAPVPSHEEPPMTARKTFEELLATRLDRLNRYVEADRRRDASNLRAQIVALCQEYGRDVPKMPENQGGRQGKGGRRAAWRREDVPAADLAGAIQNCAEAFATTPEAIAEAMEASTYRAEPAEAVQACRRLAREARSLVYQLLARLEVMPETQRLACAPDAERLARATESARLLSQNQEIAC